MARYAVNTNNIFTTIPMTSLKQTKGGKTLGQTIARDRENDSNACCTRALERKNEMRFVAKKWPD